MTGDDLEHLARLDAPLSDEERAQAANEIRRLRRALRDAHTDLTASVSLGEVGDPAAYTRKRAALQTLTRALW